MSKEAMKQWLTVLKTCRENLFLKDYVEHIDQAITSLRQAIAEAEKQEQGEPVMGVEVKRVASGGFAGNVWWIHENLQEGVFHLYTTPQPQQEQSVSVSNPIGEFPKTILAVIKEVANRNPKNGLDRWTDYETGAYMQDDADAALLWIKNKAKQEQSAEHVGEPVAATDIQISYEAHAEDPLDWNDLNLKECWHKGFADGFKAAETFHKIGVSQ